MDRKKDLALKTVLVAINAKYIHTNLAVRYLYELAKQAGNTQVSFVEYTINQRPAQLLRELYLLQADCLVFSCYIWNINLILELCEELKKVSPHTRLVLAGPEVSYDSKTLLERNPFLDQIIRGEGEAMWLPFLKSLEYPDSLPNVPSLTFSAWNHTIQENPLAPAFDLTGLPFPYGDLEELDGRILYFEASRGCPFQCGYCLSSIEQGVRFLPLPQVFAALDRFLAQRVRQVKFVDRTFNCKKSYALAIWRYLAEHDNGVTNFHFEIAGELLDEECLEFLKTVRKGQFQFEVGVQSTNETTLASITRKTNSEKLLEICRRVDQMGNIHLHLDLIAGLPWEDASSFACSFNQVFAIRPQQLQLGFLKVLKGSAIHRQAAQWDITASSRAPYEVLSTRWLSFRDLLSLKEVEEMVEIFYNSGRFSNLLEAILPCYDSPFSLFAQLGAYYTKQGHHLANHSKERHYEILRDFCLEMGLGFPAEWEQLALLDLCLHEKPKKLPNFLPLEQLSSHKDWNCGFYEASENIQTYLPDYLGEHPRRLAKITHLQWFPFALVPSGSNGRIYSAHPGETAVLFDYKANLRNLAGRAHMQILFTVTGKEST